jgi:hypothetical protein
MLSIVLQSAVAFSVIAAAVGSIVGLTAKRLSWSAKRTFKRAYFGFYVSFIVIAFVLEFVLHLDLPWPPRVLAQRGFPFSAAVGATFISLFAWLAGSLAQRLCSSAPT